MNRSKSNGRMKFMCLSIALVSSQSQVLAQEAGPECRGVAAGVVAAMRSTGELTTQAQTEIAVLAARRACTAAREDLGAAPSSSNAAVSEQAAPKEKFSMWDLLSSDQGSKPGNERLKRLRQQ